jgi:trigger factor
LVNATAKEEDSMISDKKIQETENSSVELSITLTAQSVEDAYKALITKYSKDIVVKGFRKGKAPLGLIEKKFGETIREEATFGLIEEDLKTALDEVEDKYKPLAYSQPALKDEEKLVPFKASENVTFTVSYDVIPQFETPEYKGLELEAPTASVLKADVDAEIEKLRGQNALIVSKDSAAKKDDIVTIDFVELDSEGINDRNDFTVTIGQTPTFFNLEKDLIGMKADEEKTVTKTLAEDFADADYVGKKVEIKITMKAVKYNDVPELDDDFAQDVSEDYETVDDLKAGVKKQLTERANGKLDELKYQAVMDALVEKCPIVAPKSMVDAQADQQLKQIAQQNNMDLETLSDIFGGQGKSLDSLKENWTPMIQKDINRNLIQEKIKDAEDFQITDEDVNAELASMGDLSKITEEQQKYYKEVITDNLKFSKVNEFLVKNNKFTSSKKMSYDELMNGPVEAPATEEVAAEAK